MLRRMVIGGVLFVCSLVISIASWANHDQQNCDLRGHDTASVWTDKRHVTTVDFKGSAGQFDPEPLLSTRVRTVGHDSCLVIHLSTIVKPRDNHVIYQVRVNGVPAKGHVLNLFDTGVVGVSDPNLTPTSLDAPRMASYTFVAPVEAGWHTIEVMFAGCCSTDPEVRGTVVNAATLVVHYK